MKQAFTKGLPPVGHARTKATLSSITLIKIAEVSKDGASRIFERFCDPKISSIDDILLVHKLGKAEDQTCRLCQGLEKAEHTLCECVPISRTQHEHCSRPFLRMKILD